MKNVEYITDCQRNDLDNYIKQELKDGNIMTESGSLYMFVSCLNTTCVNDYFPKNGKEKLKELYKKYPYAKYKLYYSTRSGWGCFYQFNHLIKVFY